MEIFKQLVTSALRSVLFLSIIIINQRFLFYWLEAFSEIKETILTGIV